MLKLNLHRIDVLEGIVINKTSASKESDICHYWCILDKKFKLQPQLCNGFHDVLMMSMNLNDFTILNINGAGYGCSFNRITKTEAANLLEIAGLN